MARYTGSVCRLCRREGTKLFLKGDRCYGPKCALANRQTIPGEHGQARQRKPSEYGLQLREKQKAKRAYGVMETQFHRYFETAERQKGITGENLLILLERRLDNVIWREPSSGPPDRPSWPRSGQRQEGQHSQLSGGCERRHHHSREERRAGALQGSARRHQPCDPEMADCG